MGSGCLVDTNVIIELSKKTLPQQTIDFLFSRKLLVCDVVRIEVFGFPVTVHEQASLDELFAYLPTFQLDESIVQKTIEIRKSRRINLGDAIIAATALVHDLELITRNVSDFNGIEGLNVINSHP